MQAPPPFAQVYQPPPPRNTPWGLIIALLVVGFLVVGGIAVSIAYAFLKAKKEPPAREGFGHPSVTRKIDSSWSVYELSEIPMEIRLPGRPRPSKFEDSPTAWATVGSWIAYDWNGWGTNCTLTGTWYKQPHEFRIDDSIKYLQSRYAAWFSDNHFQSKIETRTIGRLQGRELVMNYRRSGKDEVMRLFLWEHDDGIFYLATQFYKDNREEAELEYNLVLKSIQFR